MDVETIIPMVKKEEGKYWFENFWVIERCRPCFNIHNYKFIVSSFYGYNRNTSSIEFMASCIMYVLFRNDVIWTNEKVIIDGEEEWAMKIKSIDSKLYEGKELIKFLKENEIGVE